MNELIALDKPALIIPLSFAQRNEQYHNALATQKVIAAEIIEEKNLDQISTVKMLALIEDLIGRNEKKKPPRRSSKSEALYNPRKKITDCIIEWMEQSKKASEKLNIYE